ncbi:MAG: DNA helicase RecG [Anaerolineae bacterium]|nr:MAG: DNA helicase RecG [Anaerolineae bacterium]
MQSSLEKLRKFFRLEAENKYANSAVIGGLAKILDFWESEARNEGVSEEIIQLVASRLRDYHRLTPASRADTLKGVWKRIQGQADAPLPEPVYQSEATAPSTEQEPALPPEVMTPRAQPQLETAAAPSRRPAPSRSPAYAGAQTSQTPVALNANLTVLHGVGPRNAEALKKLGLYTLGDMLYNFPRRYDDYSRLKPIRNLVYGEVVTVIGQVQSLYERKARGGKMSVIECVISDGTGGLRLTWFNQPWLMNRLKEGMPIAAAGKIEQYLGRLVMNSPEWEPVESEHLRTNRIMPVYPLTANITQNWLRRQMEQVVRFWAPRLPDPLPESIRQAAELFSLGEAIQQAHFPDSQEHLQAARERLAFDEIFYLQLGVLRQKRDYQAVVGRIFDVPEDWLSERMAALPFPLTGAQKRAIEDIIVDIGSGRPMNRLIQGDVGSGKTVVAALATMMVTRQGAQAAVMAPTSILAEQHFKNFARFLVGEGLLHEGQLRLLTGDTSNGEREAIYAGLASGEIKVLIGTHALIEAPVQFKDLQLVVIDEQHRFGVEQRAALRRKGEHPHLLVMTATPIPRSLALTLYGDLDLSVIDEMPAGRQPVSTFVLTPLERERAYALIRSQVQAGRQAFIVYPLIEESQKMEDLKAAVDEHDRLSKEVFPDLKLGLLHGKMRPEEKDRIMAEFRDAKYNILVSTTVIEVGVDVPNATVMLIEGANRFGLAQLHQLRGRVGRGGGNAFCLLIPDKADSAENDRLRAMSETNDGFKLAELDLQQRGPGEFLGKAQAGHVTSLKMASLMDVALIEKARKHATQLFSLDPHLSQPEHALLAEAFNRFWGQGKGDVS